MYIFTCKDLQTSRHTHTNTYACKNACACRHTCKQTYIHAQINTRTYALMFICVHTYTHTHIHSDSSQSFLYCTGFPKQVKRNSYIAYIHSTRGLRFDSIGQIRVRIYSELILTRSHAAMHRKAWPKAPKLKLMWEYLGYAECRAIEKPDIVPPPPARRTNRLATLRPSGLKNTKKIPNN